jgi:hypothetical protein
MEDKNSQNQPGNTYLKDLKGLALDPNAGLSAPSPGAAASESPQAGNVISPA